MVDDAAIRLRADELIAQMTPAEKAGQLTQYFYFGFQRERHRRRARCRRAHASRPWWRRQLGRGEVGSLLFVTDPAEINRLQRLDGRRATGSASRRCSAST